MKKRIGEYQKSIACLESIWYGDTENSLDVIPILEIVSKMHEIKFSHLTCNTAEELTYNLGLLKQKPGYGVLYLAFHGKPGEVILANGTSVTLEKLASIMGEGFKSWIVHFGTCGTIDTAESRLSNFVQTTQTSAVFGYTVYTDWIESAAMDLILFQQFQHHENMIALWDQMTERYRELISITGLQVFLG
jgi:hypothetical protein